MKKKVGISLFLVIACVLSVIWGIQVIRVNAVVDFVGIAPKLSDEPQYLYEYAKPSIDVSLEGAFSPELDGSVVDGSPIISSVTHTALPDETIVLEGSGMSGTEVYVYGVNKQGAGEYKKAEVISSSDTTVSAIVNSDLSNGLYLVWAKNQTGISYPVRVNAPMTTYVSDTTP